MLHLFRLQALFYVCFVMFHLSILFPRPPAPGLAAPLPSESGTCHETLKATYTPSWPSTQPAYCAPSDTHTYTESATDTPSHLPHFQWNVFTFMLLPLSCKTTAARISPPPLIHPSNRISSPRISPRACLPAWPILVLYIVYPV